MRRSAPLLLLALGALLSLAVRAEEDDDSEIARLVTTVRRDGDPEAWANAVRDLRARGGDAEERLDRALAALHAEKRQALVTAARGIRALADRLGDGKSSARRLATWDASRASAQEWIFSLKSFPDVEGAIFGPQEGYDEALARGKAAVKAYRGLASALGRAVGALSRIDPAGAKALRNAHDAARRSLDRVRAEMEVKEREAVPGTEVPALAWLLLDIRAERFRSAASRFRDLPPGWIRLCVFEAYGRALLERNARHVHGQSNQAVKALAGLGRYRMALGVSPLSHNARLAEMARKHSAEMMKIGYLGHESPIPANRTMRDRARNTGYRGWVEECVSGRSSPTSAVETWKWDGGHHRIMVRETHAEAGFGNRGPCVLNTGSGEPGTPPSIRY